MPGAAVKTGELSTHLNACQRFVQIAPRISLILRVNRGPSCGVWQTRGGELRQVGWVGFGLRREILTFWTRSIHLFWSNIRGQIFPRNGHLSTEEAMPTKGPNKTVWRAPGYRSMCLMWALGVSALVGGGCGEPVEALQDGAVEVRWEVGPLGCAAAEIERVEVRLQRGERSYRQALPCADGEALLEGVEPGKYELVALGFGSSERAVFSSKTRRLSVAAERVTATDRLRLSARTAALKVRWSFENGALCANNGVDEVDISIYDHGFYEARRAQFSCERGAAELDELRAGSYIIAASARGAELTFLDHAEVQLERGEEAEIDLKMRPGE